MTEPLPGPVTESVLRTKRDLGVEAQIERIRARRGHFLTLFDFSEGRGLEIGPLDAGIADPKSHDVRYVDVFDSAGIRAHYANDPAVIPELIPEIDYFLIDGDVTRSLSEAVRPGAPYDWVIASHVIEHVPDFVGWLGQIAEVTVDGGALVLAIPDRRYCFDRHRPPTTAGQAFEAYEAGHTRPTVRAVYDYFRSAVTVDTSALWAGQRPPGREAAMHDDATVRAALDRVRAGEYVDCHVWTFTPQAFLAQVAEFRAFGICDWYVERLETPRNSVEFHAVLRKLPSGPERELLASRELGQDSDLPDWLLDEWSTAEQVRELKARIRRLRRRNRSLRRRLNALEKSTRLRIGSAVVSPFGALRRRFGRDL